MEKNKERYLMVDVLWTLLSEVAGLLNSWTLTYTSSIPDDFHRLTPNDFLNRAFFVSFCSETDFDVQPRVRLNQLTDYESLWRTSCENP